MIQLAVLDMAGTTVADDGLVISSFEAAATAAGIPADGPERDRARQYVLDTMGQSKIVVFRALFGTEDLAQRANAAFEDAYAAAIDDGHATSDRRCGRGDHAPARRRRQGGADDGLQRHAPRRSCWPRWAGSPSPTWCWRPAPACAAVPTRTSS